MGNENVRTRVSSQTNSNQEYKVVYLNGERIQIKMDEDVEIPGIVADIIARSEKFQREANNGCDINDGQIVPHKR